MVTAHHRAQPAQPLAQIPRLSWADFTARFGSSWSQGEHVTLIGTTGCGKSHLARAILAHRAYVAVLGTKPRDPTLERFRRDGYRRIERWPPRPGERRVLLWPRFRSPSDVTRQQEAFADALERIFTEESWCVYIDETRYLIHRLKLEPYLRTYWEQGRSLNLSVVATTQRPAAMPLEMYDAATHLFFWRDNDRVNLTRIGGLAGSVDSRELAAIVATLPRYEFLYLDTRTGAMMRSAVEGG